MVIVPTWYPKRKWPHDWLIWDTNHLSMMSLTYWSCLNLLCWKDTLYAFLSEDWLHLLLCQLLLSEDNVLTSLPHSLSRPASWACHALLRPPTISFSRPARTLKRWRLLTVVLRLRAKMAHLKATTDTNWNSALSVPVTTIGSYMLVPWLATFR